MAKKVRTSKIKLENPSKSEDVFPKAVLNSVEVDY
jgi:hypothetical protein